jgi:methionyl-tRNA formyltransferase
MRIIVNGMQPFGAAVLEKLVERGENIVGVYCPADKDGRVDKLTEAARAHDLPVFQPKSFKTEEVVEHVKSLEPDLAVMAYVLKFVPEDFLYVPKLGSIQYHPSLLPLHRGPSSINWPIIEGKSKTGLTIFWPDNGLDTGPVLLQKEVDIGPDDTLGSIYFDRLFPMGVDAMIEAVDLVRKMSASIGRYRGSRSITSSAAPILSPARGRALADGRWKSSTAGSPVRQMADRAKSPPSIPTASPSRLHPAAFKSSASAASRARKFRGESLPPRRG